MFPKQGTHPVGVARQYCGALGKIANCQVAVTAALWTGVRAWVTGALLYLPKPWLSDPDRRAVAHIPAGATFQEKWRQALTLIRRARGGPADHGRARRRRVRRRDRIQASAAPLASAVRGRDL